MSPPASFQTFEESLAHVGGSLCHLASLVLLSSAIWRVQSRISIAIKREQKTMYKSVYVFVCVSYSIYIFRVSLGKTIKAPFNAAAIVTNSYSTGHPSVEHPYVGYNKMQLAIMITRMKVYPMAIFGHYDIMIPCE
jgi:heme A synthase